jgi:phospholipase/carboxylesterase
VINRLSRGLAALLLSGLVVAQAFAGPPLPGDLPIGYVEQVASGAQRPLIIFLHGYGSNEQDLFSLKAQLPDNYNYLSLRAPMAVDEDAYKWFTRKPGGAGYDGLTSQLASSQALLADFIAQASAKYHTAPGQVILIGFSQGAIMAYETALRRPNSVGGIAALSGRLLPVVRGELTVSADLSRLPVFIGHGSDDPQLPVNDATEAAGALQALGMKPQLHVYPGLGHSIGEAELADLKGWLVQVLGR